MSGMHILNTPPPPLHSLTHHMHMQIHILPYTNSLEVNHMSHPHTRQLEVKIHSIWALVGRNYYHKINHNSTKLNPSKHNYALQCTSIYPLNFVLL